MTKILARLSGLSALLAASPAFAHHPLGGETPATFAHGFLSGIGHPMLGFDHFAFVVGVGLAAALTGRLWTAPLAFIAATLAGCLLIAGGIGLPLAGAAEFVIAGSVVLLGAMVLSGRRSAGAYLALFALAGLYHGGAYGQAIIGAETTPLTAYLLGFGAIQYAIAATAGLLIGRARDAFAPRLAGAAVAGVGAAFLFELVEPQIIAMIAAA